VGINRPCISKITSLQFRGPAKGIRINFERSELSRTTSREVDITIKDQTKSCIYPALRLLADRSHCTGRELAQDIFIRFGVNVSTLKLFRDLNGAKCSNIPVPVQTHRALSRVARHADSFDYKYSDGGRVRRNIRKELAWALIGISSSRPPVEDPECEAVVYQLCDSPSLRPAKDHIVFDDEPPQSIRSPATPSAMMALRQSGDATRLLSFLVERRDQLAPDLKSNRLALNREIVTVALQLGQENVAKAALAELFEANPDDGDAISKTGDIHKNRGEHEQAQQHYARLLELGRTKNVPTWVSTALANLGLLEVQHGQLNEAVNLFLQALPIEERNDRPTALANLYNNLGLAYKLRGDAGDLERAAEMYQKSIDLSKGAEILEQLANAYGNLGIIRGRQRKLEEAEQLHHQAFEVNKRIGRKLGMARAKGNLAIVYKNNGDLPKAEQAHREALMLFQEIGNREGQATAYLGIAKVLIGMNRAPHEIEPLLEKAKSYYDRTFAHPGKAETHTGYAMLREHAGDLQKAIEHLWIAANVYKQLKNRELECMRVGRVLDLAERIGDDPSMSRARQRRMDLGCDNTSHQEDLRGEDL